MNKNLSFLFKGFIFSTLLTSGLYNAQNVFSQNFNSSTTLSDYVESPASGTSNKFDGITSSGAGTTWSVAANNLTVSRTGNAGSFTRISTTGTTTGEALWIEFDLSVASSTTTTNAGTLYVGDAFSATQNSGPTGSSVNSRLGINFTTTSGNFTLRNITAGTNSGTLSGVQKITWVINNTGSSLTYTAPDGSTETVQSNFADVWTGTTRTFNEIGATTNGVVLKDFKFVISNGTGSITFDNFYIKPLSPTNLGVDLVKKDKTTIYADNGQINVKSETNVSSVEVYDTTGRLLKSSKSAQVSISRSSSPIVVVKVQLTDGTVITKKVKL